MNEATLMLWVEWGEGEELVVPLSPSKHTVLIKLSEEDSLGICAINFCKILYELFQLLLSSRLNQIF